MYVILLTTLLEYEKTKKFLILFNAFDTFVAANNEL